MAQPSEATGTPELHAEVTVDESRKFLFSGGGMLAGVNDDYGIRGQHRV